VRRIDSLDFMTKDPPIPGLEFADLVANPIGRHVIGKHEKEDWLIVKEKLRRHEGRWRGPGLVVLPE